jgi:hypothetical protein
MFEFLYLTVQHSNSMLLLVSNCTQRVPGGTLFASHASTQSEGKKAPIWSPLIPLRSIIVTSVRNSDSDGSSIAGAETVAVERTNRHSKSGSTVGGSQSAASV